MGVEFVNITVNSFNFYRPNIRDYGTVALVGVGSTQGTAPVILGSYKEADDLYKDTALGLGCKAALLNGASKVIAVDSGTSTLVDIGAALDKVMALDVQVVAIAGLHELDDTTYISTALNDHVTDAGISRIGVFQLANGEDSTTMPTAISNLKTANSDRLVGIAHNSNSEVACAVAGLIVSLKPWESPLLKPLTGITQTVGFTTTQLTGLKNAQINPLVTPTYLSGNSYVLGSDFTLGTALSGINFLDTRRVIDDISYKLKAGLTDPGIIGTLQINKAGLSVLMLKLGNILQSCIDAGEIEDFQLNFPVLAALSKKVESRSSGEIADIAEARTTRTVKGQVTVVYAGVLHQIDIDVKMTV